MSHWQLFIVGASFVYLVIAMGLYGWITSKTQPYLHYLPPEITPAFFKMIFLVTSFGWPLVLQVYIYLKIVDGIGSLAGIELQKLASIDQISMQFANKGKQVFDVDEMAESIAAKAVAEHVTEIEFAVVVDGQEKIAAFDDKETIAEILAETMPVGKFLRTLSKPWPEARQAVGVGPDGGPIFAPTKEEIADSLASAHVPPMTKLPTEEELEALDKIGIAKLLFAVASDRARACQALFDLEDNVRPDKETPTVVYTPTLQKQCSHARAVVDEWMNLVK